MIQTNISLPEELHKAIKLYAFEHGISMAETIRIALTTSMFMMERGKKIIEKEGLKPGLKEQAQEIAADMKKRFVPEVIEDTVGRPAGEMNADDYLGQVPWGK